MFLGYGVDGPCPWPERDRLGNTSAAQLETDPTPVWCVKKNDALNMGFGGRPFFVSVSKKGRHNTP